MVNPRKFSLEARMERWPIKGTFMISRGAKTESVVVVAELTDGHHRGRGECVPYARYGETPETVLRAIEQLSARIAGGLDRLGLQAALPPGAARNAIDCAFWDFEAKRKAIPVWQLAGLPAPHPVVTAYTISLGTPQEMAAAANAEAHRPLLKIKLGGEDDPARIAAIRSAAPHCELIVDANEAWRPEWLERNLAACAAAGVTLVEQPLPADADTALAQVRHAIPICADESAHDRASLAALAGKYDAINIKLDKAGGLTEALALAAEARRRGFAIMVGCMVATSLAMAPAMLVAQAADVVDLDGALLLAKDRADGLAWQGHRLHPPVPALWG